LIEKRLWIVPDDRIMLERVDEQRERIRHVMIVIHDVDCASVHRSYS